LPPDEKKEEFPAKNVIFLEACGGDVVNESPDAKRGEDDEDDNWKLSSSGFIEDFECVPCQQRFETELALQDHIGEKHNRLEEKKTQTLLKQTNKKKLGKKASKNDLKINSIFTCETIGDVSRLEHATEKCSSSNVSNLVIVSKNDDILQTAEKNYSLKKKKSITQQSFDLIASYSFEADTKTKLKEKDNLKINDKNWICPVCDKKFDFRSRLARHSIIHNSENQERQFECPTCQKKFLRSGKTRIN
jgi:hypothetical protein